MTANTLPPNAMWFVFIDHDETKFCIKGPMQPDSVKPWKDAVSDLNAKGKNVEGFTSHTTKRDDIASFWNGQGYADLAILSPKSN